MNHPPNMLLLSRYCTTGTILLFSLLFVLQEYSPHLHVRAQSGMTVDKSIHLPTNDGRRKFVSPIIDSQNKLAYFFSSTYSPLDQSWENIICQVNLSYSNFSLVSCEVPDSFRNAPFGPSSFDTKNQYAYVSLTTQSEFEYQSSICRFSNDEFNHPKGIYPVVFNFICLDSEESIVSLVLDVENSVAYTGTSEGKVCKFDTSASNFSFVTCVNATEPSHGGVNLFAMAAIDEDHSLAFFCGQTGDEYNPNATICKFDISPSNFALVSCTVLPGLDGSDLASSAFFAIDSKNLLGYLVTLGDSEFLESYRITKIDLSPFNLSVVATRPIVPVRELEVFGVTAFVFDPITSIAYFGASRWPDFFLCNFNLSISNFSFISCIPSPQHHDRFDKVVTLNPAPVVLDAEAGVAYFGGTSGVVVAVVVDGLSCPKGGHRTITQNDLLEIASSTINIATLDTCNLTIMDVTVGSIKFGGNISRSNIVIRNVTCNDTSSSFCIKFLTINPDVGCLNPITCLENFLSVSDIKFSPFAQYTIPGNTLSAIVFEQTFSIRNAIFANISIGNISIVSTSTANTNNNIIVAAVSVAYSNKVELLIKNNKVATYAHGRFSSLVLDDISIGNISTSSSVSSLSIDIFRAGTHGVVINFEVASIIFSKNIIFDIKGPSDVSLLRLVATVPKGCHISFFNNHLLLHGPLTTVYFVYFSINFHSPEQFSADAITFGDNYFNGTELVFPLTSPIDGQPLFEKYVFKCNNWVNGYYSQFRYLPSAVFECPRTLSTSRSLSDATATASNTSSESLSASRSETERTISESESTYCTNLDTIGCAAADSKCKFCPNINLCLPLSHEGCDGACSILAEDQCTHNHTNGGCKFCTEHNVCVNATTAPTCECLSFDKNLCFIARSTCNYCSSESVCVPSQQSCGCINFTSTISFNNTNSYCSASPSCHFCPQQQTCLPQETPCTCHDMNQEQCDVSFLSPLQTSCKYCSNISFCAPKAIDCACTVLPTQHVCNATGGCHWCSNYSTCAPKDDWPDCNCDSLRNSDFCSIISNDHCKWCSDASICTDPSFNCECDLFSKSMCSKSKCNWCDELDSCTVEQNKNCDCYYLSKEEQCSSPSKCSWCPASDPIGSFVVDGVPVNFATPFSVTSNFNYCVNKDADRCDCSYLSKDFCQFASSPSSSKYNYSSTCKYCSNLDLCTRADENTNCDCGQEYSPRGCSLTQSCLVQPAILTITDGHAYCAQNTTANLQCPAVACQGIKDDPFACVASNCSFNNDTKICQTADCFYFFIPGFTMQPYLLYILGLFKDIIVVLLIGAIGDIFTRPIMNILFKIKRGFEEWDHIKPRIKTETVYMSDRICREGYSFSFPEYVEQICANVFEFSDEDGNLKILDEKYRIALFDITAFCLFDNMLWIEPETDYSVSTPKEKEQFDHAHLVDRTIPSAENDTSNEDDLHSPANREDFSQPLLVNENSTNSPMTSASRQIVQLQEKDFISLAHLRRKVQPALLERASSFVYYTQSRSKIVSACAAINSFPSALQLLCYIIVVSVLYITSFITVSNFPHITQVVSKCNSFTPQNAGVTFGGGFLLLGFRLMNASASATSVLILVKTVRGMYQKYTGLYRLSLTQRIPLMGLLSDRPIQITLIVYALLIAPFALAGPLYGGIAIGWQCWVPILVGLAVILANWSVLFGIRWHLRKQHLTADELKTEEESEKVKRRSPSNDVDDEGDADYDRIVDDPRILDTESEVSLSKVITSTMTSRSPSRLKQGELFNENNETNAATGKVSILLVQLGKAILDFLLTEEVPVIAISLALQVSFNYMCLLHFSDAFGVGGGGGETVYAKDYGSRKLECVWEGLEKDASSVVSLLSSVIPF